MAAQGQPVEVRTFQSEHEIQSEPGFVEHYLVHKENYERLLGDYRLADKMRCCLKNKAGGLCGQPHNYGFVVRLKDGSVSIIGNRCGKSHFDADSQVAKDMNLYANAKRRLETQQRVAELLRDKEDSTAQIQTMHASLLELTKRVGAISANLGVGCIDQLRTIARGTGRVVAIGVRIRPYEENGEKLFERQKLTITIGSLRGTRVFLLERIRSIRNQLQQVMNAYRTAEAMDGSVSTKELASVAATLSDLPRIIAEGQVHVQGLKEFEDCDWMPLAFLVRDQGERYKIARLVLNHTGSLAGKDKAKEWLQQIESRVKESNGVDRLEIMY